MLKIKISSLHTDSGSEENKASSQISEGRIKTSPIMPESTCNITFEPVYLDSPVKVSKKCPNTASGPVFSNLVTFGDVISDSDDNEGSFTFRKRNSPSASNERD